MKKTNKARTLIICFELLAEIKDKELYLQLYELQGCFLKYKQIVVDWMENQEKLYKENKDVKEYWDNKLDFNLLTKCEVDLFLQDDKVTEFFMMKK